MIFGITVTLITIAAIALAFLPALRGSPKGVASSRRDEFEHDLAVYKDQLKELQVEIARASINPADAEQARTEIARRLLAAEAKISEIDDTAKSNADRKFGSIAIMGIAFVFVPAIALLTYYSLGSPEIEAQPLQARILAAQSQQLAENAEGEQLRTLVERAEVHLKSNPSDGRGWDVLAPIYFRLGEVEKAREAYTRAIGLLGESAARLSGLGEVETAIAGGVVNAPAKSHFEAAAAVDPNEGRSQFFLGLADAQSGNVQQAARVWQSLSQNANSQSEWRTLARQQLAVLSRSQSLDSASAPQIDQDTINEIQNMSVEDRQAMIDGMVAQLDARLSEQGGSVEEWQRLIRARLVLDQREAAQNDLIRALEAFSNDAEKADQLRAFAFELNLSNEAIEAQ